MPPSRLPQVSLSGPQLTISARLHLSAASSNSVPGGHSWGSIIPFTHNVHLVQEFGSRTFFEKYFESLEKSENKIQCIHHEHHSLGKSCTSQTAGNCKWDWSGRNRMVDRTSYEKARRQCTRSSWGSLMDHSRIHCLVLAAQDMDSHLTLFELKLHSKNKTKPALTPKLKLILIFIALNWKSPLNLTFHFHYFPVQCYPKWFRKTTEQVKSVETIFIDQFLADDWCHFKMIRLIAISLSPTEIIRSLETLCNDSEIKFSERDLGVFFMAKFKGNGDCMDLDGKASVYRKINLLELSFAFFMLLNDWQWTSKWLRRTWNESKRK